MFEKLDNIFMRKQMLERVSNVLNAFMDCGFESFRGSEYWFNKGNALFNQGNDSEAIECYDIAIAINKNDATCWNNKGNALFNQGNHGKAIECYDKAIAIDKNAINKNNAIRWNNKGNALFNQGNYGKAIECYDKAIAIDKNDAHPWNNKGNALFKVARYREAIECYDKAIAIDKNSVCAVAAMSLHPPQDNPDNTNDEMIRMTKELDKVNKENQALKDEKQKLIEGNNALIEENNAMKTKLKEAEQSGNAGYASLDIAHIAYDNLKKGYEKSMREQIQETEKIQKTLSQEIEVHKKEKLSLKEELEQAKIENSGLREEVTNLKIQIGIATEKFEAIDEENKKAMSVMKDEIKELKAHVTILMNQKDGQKSEEYNLKNNVNHTLMGKSLQEKKNHSISVSSKLLPETSLKTPSPFNSSH